MRRTPYHAELMRDAKLRVSSSGGVRPWRWASFVDSGRRRSDAASVVGGGISFQRSYEISSPCGDVDKMMMLTWGGWIQASAMLFRRRVVVRWHAGPVSGCRRPGSFNFLVGTMLVQPPSSGRCARAGVVIKWR